MPRHLISDAHEWINEILTVPIYALANPQSRERAWQRRRGKKTLLSLTLVWYEKWFWRCRISGSFGKIEIPLLWTLFFSVYEKGDGGHSRCKSRVSSYSWINCQTRLHTRLRFECFFCFGLLYKKHWRRCGNGVKSFSYCLFCNLDKSSWAKGVILRCGWWSLSVKQDLGTRQFQMGSLAGAARMWKDSACVQRATQWEQKSHVE